MLAQRRPFGKVEATTPPPEPLSIGPMCFVAFRARMHRNLKKASMQGHKKKDLLDIVIEEAQNPCLPHGLQTCMPGTAQERIIPGGLRESEGQSPLFNEDKVAVLPCHGLDMLSAERLRAVLKAASGASLRESSQHAFDKAKDCGSLVVSSSKRVFEAASRSATSLLVAFRCQLVMGKGVAFVLARQDAQVAAAAPRRSVVPEVPHDQGQAAPTFLETSSGAVPMARRPCARVMPLTEGEARVRTSIVSGCLARHPCRGATALLDANVGTERRPTTHFSAQAAQSLQIPDRKELWEAPDGCFLLRSSSQMCQQRPQQLQKKPQPKLQHQSQQKPGKASDLCLHAGDEVHLDIPALAKVDGPHTGGA